MTKYYVYSAEGCHDYLGEIIVKDNDANNIGRLLTLAQKEFRQPNLRISAERSNFKPPKGKLRIKPNVARRAGAGA